MKPTNQSASFARLALLVTVLAGTAPTVAAAQSARHSSSSHAGDQSTYIGGLLGFEDGDVGTGLALRFDGQMPITRLGTGPVHLDGVVSLGYSHFSDFGLRLNILKVVPAARFVFPIAPQFSLYADAGLGLYYDSVSVRGFSGSDSGAGLTMRFAGGGFFQVNDRLRLGGELGVNPYFGDYDDTTLSVMFSLMYRL